MLGGLAPLGVNQIGGVNFTFQNPDKFTAIARGNALTNAATEASELAGQAGASLGEVVTVTESSNVPYPVPMYAAMRLPRAGTQWQLRRRFSRERKTLRMR